MKKIGSALCALTAVCALLAGCAAPCSAQSLPGATAAAGAEAMAGGSVPDSSYYTLSADEYSQNAVLYGGGRVIYNGPGSAAFVLDAATGQTAGYYVGRYGADAVSYTLYDLSGRELLACGPACPDALLNGWVHLQYNAVAEIGGESESAYQNLETGERRLEGYLAPEKLAENTYLVTRSGMPPTSMLVNVNLEITKDLAPWYAVSSSELAPDYLNAYCEGSGQETGIQNGLLQVATGELLEGFYAACGPGLACFQQGEKYVVRDLAAGQVLASGPHPFRWYAGGDQVLCPPEGGCIATLNGKQYACQWVDWQGGVFWLNLQDGGQLLLGTNGRVLADSAELGAQYLSLLPGGYYTVGYGQDGRDVALYSPTGGQLARDSRYNYIYNQWGGPRFRILYDVFCASYQQGRANLYDLLGADGAPLLTGLNRIYSADEYGAAVRRGFTRGVMDYQGRWVWSESIFDSFEDEEDELW